MLIWPKFIIAPFIYDGAVGFNALCSEFYVNNADRAKIKCAQSFKTISMEQPKHSAAVIKQFLLPLFLINLVRSLSVRSSPGGLYTSPVCVAASSRYLTYNLLRVVRTKTNTGPYRSCAALLDNFSLV